VASKSALVGATVASLLMLVVEDCNGVRPAKDCDEASKLEDGAPMITSGSCALSCI
jgi:hypothetical protein